MKLLRFLFLKHDLAIVLLLSVLFCSRFAESQTNPLPEIFRVRCLNSVSGCACFGAAEGERESARLFHAEAVYRDGPDAGGRTPVRIGDRRCFYPVSGLLAKPYAPVLSSPMQNLDHAPLAFSALAPETRRNADPARFVAENTGSSLGHYWATYYHLALEDFHPGPAERILSPSGQTLGTASRSFLEQVMWEGSGISRSGLRLHYSGTALRFNLYPEGIWGHGAGSGFKVYPYRTIALNFPAFCRALGMPAGCRKDDVIGTLVYIPEIAARQIRMSDGSTHDGFFCANDTGSPNYIRDDRIDIFVGTHGGGNPYLPPARQANLLIAGGIENLVPADWRLWTADNTRVWCDRSRLPNDGAAPRAGDCTHDYHTVAWQKRLSLFAFRKSGGAYVRCATNPQAP